MGVRVDVAITTVIRAELEAMRRVLGFGERNHEDGDIFYLGTVPSQVNPSRPISFALYAQGKAGNSLSEGFCGRIIDRHRPSLVILAGICAGIRGATRIGNVVGPLAVADQTLSAVTPHGLEPRPVIEPLPYVVSQMCAHGSVPDDEWKSLLSRTYGDTPPKSPSRSILTRLTGRLIPGQQQQLHGVVQRAIDWLYDARPRSTAQPLARVLERFWMLPDDIAWPPEYREAVLYSNNLLLRDPRVLPEHKRRFHQQTLVAEMEAAGFIGGCRHRGTIVPWFVLRSVSDFADSLKGDGYHKYASHAVATYLALWLQHVLDLDALPPPTSPPSPAPAPPGPGSSSPQAPPTLMIDVLDFPIVHIQVNGRDVGISPSGLLVNFPARSVRVRVSCAAGGPNAERCDLRLEFGGHTALLWDRSETIYADAYRDVEVAQLAGTSNKLALFIGGMGYTVPVGEDLRFQVTVQSANGGRAVAELTLPLVPTYELGDPERLDDPVLEPPPLTVRQGEVLEQLAAELADFRRAVLVAVRGQGEREHVQAAIRIGDQLSHTFDRLKVNLPLSVPAQEFLDVFNALYRCVTDASVDQFSHGHQGSLAAARRFELEANPKHAALLGKWQKLLAVPRAGG